MQNKNIDFKNKFCNYEFLAKFKMLNTDAKAVNGMKKNYVLLYFVAIECGLLSKQVKRLLQN